MLAGERAKQQEKLVLELELADQADWVYCNDHNGLWLQIRYALKNV